MKIVLIITGSVAAYKALELIRIFKKTGVDVLPVLSPGALQFITPQSASALSGNKALVEDDYQMEHISVARRADLILVCPASASFINRFAAGSGGELALDLLLAKKPSVPVVLCPAMNVEMWKNDIVQKSLKALQDKGVKIIEPTSGELLCKEEGCGKLEDVFIIFAETLAFLKARKRFTGKKILITLGATRERIDDVRFISNFSTGTQGIEVMRVFLEQGATVFVLNANVPRETISQHPNLHVINVESARDLQKEAVFLVKKHKFEAFISVCAVADFYVKNAKAGKIKKKEMPSALQLAENPDTLKEIGGLKKNRPRVVFGFAVESENLLKNGKKKLAAKNCDVLYVNKMCFGGGETEGIILSEPGNEKFLGTKKELAKKVAEIIFKIL